MIWTRPKHFVPDQNNLDGPKSFWTNRRTRHQTLKSNIKLILGYECSCHSGFKINPDDPSMCNDIDECSESYPCSQTCLNTPGSYKCSCLPGYLPLDQDPTRCKADSSEEFLILFTSR